MKPGMICEWHLGARALFETHSDQVISEVNSKVNVSMCFMSDFVSVMINLTDYLDWAEGCCVEKITAGSVYEGVSGRE